MTTDSNEQQGEALEPCHSFFRPVHISGWHKGLGGGGWHIKDSRNKIILEVSFDETEEREGRPITGGNPAARAIVALINDDSPRASLAAVANHALVQLLESALLHPDSAEGNIRQVIEMLSLAAVEGDALDRIQKAVDDASEERYQSLKEWEQLATRWQSEGDMYGWNFHQGMMAGANYVDIYYHRVTREIEAVRDAAASSPLPADEHWQQQARKALWNWTGLDSLSIPQLDELVGRIAAALHTRVLPEQLCTCTDHDPEVCLNGEVDEGSRYCHCECHTPAEPPQDSCSHWREGDSDNCVWCGDDLGPTTKADVAPPLQPEGEQGD